MELSAASRYATRYSEKRGHPWRGYTVHLTETCDDDAPSIMTHVETTFAPEQEVTVVETIHHRLADQALLPSVHIVDGAYTYCMSRRNFFGGKQLWV